MAHSTLPSLDVVGPDGERLSLRALDRDDTVGSLARELGSENLWTTRRELHPNERLADIDELRIGARLVSERPDAPARPSDEPSSNSGSHANVAEIAVVAGPSSTAWTSLPTGRHLVGRAHHASIRIDDPAIEIHHALLILDADGSFELIQLTGVVPMRIDGHTLTAGVRHQTTQADGSAAGRRLTLGASVIEIRPPGAAPPTSLDSVVDHTEPRGGPPRGSIAAHPSDPWRRIVWRAPFDPPHWAADAVTAPTRPNEPNRPPFSGLIGAGVTACGAVVIAQVMDNAMFMLFGAMGVVATLATFMVGSIVAFRARRRVRRGHDGELVAFGAQVVELRRLRIGHHRVSHPTLAEAICEVLGSGGRLWRHRPDRDPAAPLMAVIGTGTHRWSPPIEIPDHRHLDPTLLQEVERCSRLDGVAAPITIRAGEAIAVNGPLVHARSVARSVVAQLATWVGPADWQLVVVTRDERAWRWVDWLPHGALDGRSAIVLDGHSDALGEQLDAVDEQRRTLVVTDEPQLFTARTGPLRRFLGSSGAASLVIVDTEETVPALCRRMLVLGSTGSASWAGDVPAGDDAIGIEFTGLSIGVADEIARRLACLIDPEDDGGASGAVPNTVRFAELMPASATTAGAIAERWRSGGSDPAPTAPLGWSMDGRVDVDLVRDGPHGLIAGTTGAGKSELLRTLVLSLAASVGPQHLNFVLVDYKGGSTFDACTALPHTVGLVTDLDDGLAERALASLEAELHRRERLLRSVGAADLSDYRSRGQPGVGTGSDVEPIARLVVVIDEFAALAKELPDFLAALVGVAQRGRSLGVHLLLATQRPAGVVNDDIRANTNLRLALRLHDRPDALDVVGDERPATFPRGLPGRAALRLGPDELVVFQAARCTGPVPESGGGLVVERPDRRRRGMQVSPDADLVQETIAPDQPSELEATVRAIIDAAAIDGVQAPHRPWMEPLPFPLGHGDVLAGCRGSSTGPLPIGLIDDPGQQGRSALTWTPGSGSIALVGSIGSGTTSTMISLASSVCAARRPDEIHLYVIDARGDDGLTGLASIAHCGGVVRLNEDERLHRLLARVVSIIDRRTGATSEQGNIESQVVVMIDGYSSLRTALGAVERTATHDLLLRVVNDGPSAEVALVVADDATTATSMLNVTHRWLFHLDDPAAARGLGLRAPPVGDGRPGRLRILASGLEAQIARGAPGLAELPSHGDSDGDSDGGPLPIEQLPARVDATEVAVRARCDVAADDPPNLLVGLDADDLEPAWLAVPDGDHVLVVGGPRTGVSTALERCVEAWRHTARARGRPHRVIRVGRRNPLDPADLDDDSHATAIVVDDAHRVDDDGTLARIALGDHAHVTLIAGARADGVRSGYGHWTRELAKCRCGIVMASRGDPDGDVLGVQIPRRSLVPARAGLAWIVDTGPLRQVQIAC